ncbi:MAG: hypothetical protein P4L10_10475 [Acidobacteriaceae bacterium]|jgi:hypothetical protein|nr:hypothetical protein [Acidobacteriaceae bacterium]
MSETGNQIAGLTDADFRRTILRAIRLTAIVATVGIPLLWWKLGWQSAVYMVVGAGISASGLYEWLQLMTAVMRRMDAPTEGGEPAKVRLVTPVLLGFFVRMGLAVVVLYAILKTLDGSVYALAGGLLLGVIALSIEAFRMMRLWTV